MAVGNAVGTLKYIAGGAFGKAALEGGNEMVVWCAVFHYIIALCWTAAFLLLYPKMPFMKWNKWFNAIAYGIVIQTLMSFVVLPLSLNKYKIIFLVCFFSCLSYVSQVKT